MKNKIKILLTFCVLFVIFTNDLFAWKITMSGKGRHGYNYVYINDQTHTIICSSPGTIDCPSLFTRVIGQTGKDYSMEEIVNLVLKEVESGKMNGSGSYQDGITYNWTAKNETDMEIDILDFSK